MLVADFGDEQGLWSLSLPPVQDEEELGGRLAGKPAQEAESGWQRDAPAS
jgi:hypothetical protein